MSSSTDSLKKKICVTVFLDELFEEVVEDDWRELKHIRNVSGSEVKIAEKRYSESSRIGLDNDEKANVFSNADSEQLHVQFRPRKHRRESKFSKNLCDSFENELTKYDYGSCDKRKNECLEHVESTADESDFVLDEFLKLDKWEIENGSSSSELSKLELKGGNPILSTVMKLDPSEVKISKEKLAVSFCNKSTQFDGVSLEDKKIINGYCVEKKERKPVKDVLVWKETQKQIHLISARSKQWKKESYEGDYLQHYDLRSILERCMKANENSFSKGTFANSKVIYSNPSMDFKEYDLFDSYTCVFPYNKQKNTPQAPEVKKVWDRAKKSAWKDGFESDLSEEGCTQNITGFNLHPCQKDALLSCTLGLKCEKKSREEEENRNSEIVQSSDDFEYSRGSSLESIKSRTSQKTDLFYKTVFDLARKTVLEVKLKTKQEKVREDTKNEGDFQLKSNRSLLAPENKNKNFAEGDTFEEFLNQDSKLILDIKAKEKLLVCDEILKHVPEPKVIQNEIIVSRAEVEFDSQENARKKTEVELSPCQSFSVSQEVAEVFFKQKDFENMEKSLTDIESAMIFAESENFFYSEDFLDNGLMCSYTREPQNNVCVVEIEDKLPRSEILRRTKTVKIFGNRSLNDMKNISTEVILVCENISNKEVCLEAWHKSISTLKSLTEMRQCYLKDSKDSTMYLIEIPLHFIRVNRKKHDCNQFFKCPDSD